MKDPAPGPPLGPSRKKRLGILGAHRERYASGCGVHTSSNVTPSRPMKGVAAELKELCLHPVSICNGTVAQRVSH